MIQLTVVWVLLAVLLCPAMVLASDSDSRFKDHGVLAPVATPRGVFATNDRNGRPLIVAWAMDYQSCQLLVIDAETGQTDVVLPPHDNTGGPFHNLLSEGRLYSLFNGWFYEFDVAERSFTFIQQVADDTAMGMTLGDDGTVYVGTYPKGHLLAFEPKSRTLTDFGQLSPEEWKQYPAVMATDKAGWVYLGIGTVKSKLVAFNPATREVIHVFGDELRRNGYAYPTRARDGYVYATPYRDGPLFRVYEGKATPVDEQPVARVVIDAGSQNSVLGRFADGSTIEGISIADRYALIRTPGEAAPRRITFDYACEGARLFSLVKGEDGKIYGATGHPFRIVQFDPASGDAVNWGRSGFTFKAGHINVLATHKGQIFGGYYGGGILLRIDPAKQQRDSDASIEQLARDGDEIKRPNALVAHIDGQHLIMTGMPEYGRTGGGMMIYDLKAQTHRMIPEVELVPDHSTMAVAVLADGTLLGGTTTRASTGGIQKADEALLYLADWPTVNVAKRIPLGKDVREVRDLLTLPTGVVLGQALCFDGSVILFTFDPKTKTVTRREAFGVGAADTAIGAAGLQGPNVMAIGDDGLVYVLLAKAIYCIDPSDFSAKHIATSPVDIHNGIVIQDGRLYFVHNSHLYSYDLTDDLKG